MNNRLRIWKYVLQIEQRVNTFELERDGGSGNKDEDED